MTAGPAGLYLHVPFCARICPYCDFAVRTGDRERKRRFVDHLIAEIALHHGEPLEFDTIYFGGGTPSALEAAELGRVLEAIRSNLRVAADARLFLEANPEDVTAAATAAWRRLGVTTVSIGVQSLDATDLGFLGRQHAPRRAERAIELALLAGFETVSLDLIYGLPGQTLAGWGKQLERAVELRPDHISCYQLTIHQRTRFALLERRGELRQLPADELAKLFLRTHRQLGASGYPGYEISNFARAPEHHSRHNAKYWNHTPYLGLGPSAHSFRGSRRWWNVRRTDPWQEQVAEGRRPVEDSEVLDAGSLALESLMLGLRRYSGVDLSQLRDRWSVELLRDNASLLERLESAGLVSLSGQRLIPSIAGLAVADSVAASFDVRPS